MGKAGVKPKRSGYASMLWTTALGCVSLWALAQLFSLPEMPFHPFSVWQTSMYPSKPIWNRPFPWVIVSLCSTPSPPSSHQSTNHSLKSLLWLCLSLWGQAPGLTHFIFPHTQDGTDMEAHTSEWMSELTNEQFIACKSLTWAYLWE